MSENIQKNNKLDTKKIGKRLTKLREDKEKELGKKLSKSKVSKDMGLGINTLGLYEIGEKIPDIQQLIKIRNYYNVSYDYLLGVSDNPSPDFKVQAEKNQKAINDIKRILIDLQKQN